MAGGVRLSSDEHSDPAHRLYRVVHVAGHLPDVHQDAVRLFQPEPESPAAAEHLYLWYDDRCRYRQGPPYGEGQPVPARGFRGRRSEHGRKGDDGREGHPQRREPHGPALPGPCAGDDRLAGQGEGAEELRPDRPSPEGRHPDVSGAGTL